MTKNASLVIISIIMVLVLALGVFSFIPTFAVGAYQEYHAPASLIQLGAGFTDTQFATFDVVEDSIPDDAESADLTAEVSKVIADRLGYVYGMHDSKIDFADDTYTVSVPTTTHHDTTVKPAASTMLQSVSSTGVVEILTSAATTYDVKNVIMSASDDDATYFRSASVSQMSSGANKYYIVNVKLTGDGLELANDKLAHVNGQVSGYCAVDGTISYQVAHTLSKNSLQVYTGSLSTAKALASYVNYGYLPVELEFVETDSIELATPMAMIIALAFLALVLIVLIVAIAKYRLLALSLVMSTATLAVGLVIFAGLAYFSVFNISAVIGFALGLVLYAYCNLYTLGNVANFNDKSTASAVKLGFNKSWKRVLIVAGIALVVGVALWLIPTGITISLGNALAYSAIVTLLGALALNRLFANLVAPLCGEVA